MVIRGKPTSRRIVKGQRVTSKKYKITTDPPMHAAAFQTTALPSKLEVAKLNYDLAVEEAAQKKIVQEIEVLDRELKNERARYQNKNRVVVRSESQLLTGSRTYNMLKRQKETLQREQQSSLERLTNLSAKQRISASPIDSATKAFKGISKRNPMRRGRQYVPVVPASAKSPLENLGGAFKGLTQPLPEAEALPLGTLPRAVQTGARAFATAQTKGAGRMVKKEIQDQRWTAMKDATKFDVEQKIAELKVKHPDNPNMWTEKQARIEIGEDAANKTKQLLGEERSGSLFPGVATPKVAFTGEVKGKIDDPIGPFTAPEAALQERQATEKLAKLSGRKILPGRRGAGQFYSKELVDLKKMAAGGAVLGAGVTPLNAAYGDVYQATPTTPTVNPDSPLGQAYESSKPTEPKTPSPTYESRLAEVEARGAGGIAEGTLYKEGFFEDFALGASDVGQDYLDMGKGFTAGDEGDEWTSLSSRSSMFHLTDSAAEQGWAYAFEPEKFAMWEKQGGHPLDQAIDIASKKSIMRLAGEAAVEGGIIFATGGSVRALIGGVQGARLASKGILVGSKTAALSKAAKGANVTKYVKPISEGGKAGKKVRKPKRGAALTEAKRIQAGGKLRGIKYGLLQAGLTTVRDPTGFMEIRHLVSGVGRIGAKIRYPGKKIQRVSNTKSVDLQAQRRAAFLSKYIEPFVYKTSPGYELPTMASARHGSRFGISGKGALAADLYELKPATSITKSRGIKGIPRMDVDSIAPLYKAKVKPRKPAHLKKYPKATKTKQTKIPKKIPPKQKRKQKRRGLGPVFSADELQMMGGDIKKAGEYVFWKQPVIGIGGGAVAGTFAYGHVTGQIGKKPEKGK